MKKLVNLFRPIYWVLLAASAVIAVLTALVDQRIFLISAALWMIAFAYMLITLYFSRRQVENAVQELGRLVAKSQEDTLTEYPFPVMVLRGDREIAWYNQRCQDLVLGGRDWYGHLVQELLPDLPLDKACPPEGYNVKLSGRMFTAYVIRADSDDMYVLYFIDDDKLKFYANEYFQSRPAVLLMMVDNYEELFQNAKEKERGLVMGEIEGCIDTFIEGHNGLVRKLYRETYMAIVEERHLQEIIKERFSILDSVRKVRGSDKMIQPTMSIGVGRGGKLLRETEQLAQQALDMALGRGGDQAAIKTQNGYEFYGGVSKTIEKRNKVRTRIVANALAEIVMASDKVLIMGHRMGDLDSLGASIGMLGAVEQLGKPAFVAINKNTTLAGPLLQMVLEKGYGDRMLMPAEALEMVTPHTLLVIVDTHIENLVESKELYEACRNVVVIDHHRKMVGHIANAVIFYHEPYASSASEMVTELAQYLGENTRIRAPEAAALLAGITLDTKNFTIRTGVRTFEAAAYLRRMGADTVQVRQLFSSSMSAYQQKSALVSTAEIHHGCAITGTDASDIPDIRIAAPQAADELLTISGVSASFVMYDKDGSVNISARSLGAINVQLIMEKLGGGGHQTMAAAQLAGKNLEEARELLVEAINEYFAENGDPSLPEEEHNGK